jgi:hypothetical protein
VADYETSNAELTERDQGEDFFSCREDLMAARILSRRAFNLMNPVASLWSYADASAFIVAIFGSYKLRGLLRPATMMSPLYSLSRTTPVTPRCVSVMSACNASRSGENQKPL